MWRRRELFGALGTGAAGLALLANRSEAAQGQAPVPEPKHSGLDPRHAEMLRTCEEACGHCEATCETTFHHCIKMAGQGKTNHASMAQMVADCAAFCSLSATMIARHSSLMVESCRACAEACRRCAQECGSADVDETMKTCITACRRCEESCRNMVRAMGGEHGHGHGSERPAERGAR
jgi:hypothetical protein